MDVVYEATVHIGAPPARVYAYRLDFTTLPAYNASVSNMRRIDGGAEPGAGAEYVFDLTIGGETAETPLRVLEAEPDARVVIETGPAYMAREVCTFAPAEGGTRCEFVTTLRFPADVDEATADIVRATGLDQVTSELEMMKKNLES
jgi:uncharacterized protein YndB with AHSA1/START domain